MLEHAIVIRKNLDEWWVERDDACVEKAAPLVWRPADDLDLVGVKNDRVQIALVPGSSLFLAIDEQRF